MESGFLLDIVVREGTAVLELLSSEDQTLLIGRNALLILNLALDVVNGIGALDLESDGLARNYRFVLASEGWGWREALRESRRRLIGR
jgi:hypothetical protein